MKQKILAAAAIVLLAAACGSIGSLGDILGSTGSSNPSDIRGVVTSVDSYNKSIHLDVSYINNLRDSRQGSVIYWDSRTEVRYQNRTYSPTDLERGDEVSVTGHNDSGRYVADVIDVIRDVTG